MNRASWIRMQAVAAAVLSAVGIVAGAAWADPSGAANIRQVSVVSAFLGTETAFPQRTFLTTDAITAGAIYYDPADVCAGVDPATVKFFVLNPEGELVLGRNRDTTGGVTNVADDTAPKYQTILATLDPGALAVGSYNLVFRIEACPAGSPAIIVSDFYSIEVFAP